MLFYLPKTLGAPDWLALSRFFIILNVHDYVTNAVLIDLQSTYVIKLSTEWRVARLRSI